MNIKLLNEVKRAILAHPTQVNMDSWFNSFGPRSVKPKGCGTAGCIAGWALYLDAKKKNKPLTLQDVWAHWNRTREYESRAASCLLELDNWERLFLIDEWPDAFIVKLQKAKTPKGYARVVAQRIDKFIETKGAV